MKQSTFEIIKNDPLTKDICRMVLRGDVSAIKGPGEFVNIKLESLYLRRPISVCDVDRDAGTLTLRYKVVGVGTDAMKDMHPGDKLDILTGLGKGYDTSLSGDKPLLIGGGVGVPPMYLLAKALISEGKAVTVILGFNTAEDVFYEQEFKALGATVFVATVDGSYGSKGFVTDVIANEKIEYSYFFSCGPKPMLKALCDSTDTSGQLSLEERMGCGFGVCMGCTCKTVKGAKRVCKNGPVFKKEAIVWED